MPLEATMMILDNSEYMRNGDYAPTRFDAMADAAHIIFTTKTDSNPENSVGIMTGAGKAPEVLVTHTRELGQIVAGAHVGKSKIGGNMNTMTAINVAQLALKHRQNKNLRQRIIIFVGSPPEDEDVDDGELTKLAKKLKKNNVALDIVAFGDGIELAETSKLKRLVEGVNNGDNSHYVAIEPDPRRLLSDCVVSSSVLADDRGDRDAAMADMTGGGAGPSAAGGFDEYGGIDPNVDPELAMVMRMSMEEERARQRAAEQAASGGATAEASTPAPAAESSSAAPVPAAVSAAAPGIAAVSTEMTDDDEDEAALREALLMSQEDVQMDEAGPGAATAATGADDDEDFDEDAAIQEAIEMSMHTEQQNPEQKK